VVDFKEFLGVGEASGPSPGDIAAPGGGR